MPALREIRFLLPACLSIIGFFMQGCGPSDGETILGSDANGTAASTPDHLLVSAVDTNAKSPAPSTPKPTPIMQETLPPTIFLPTATPTPTPSTAHAYDPCSGKAEGESCTMCPSGGERGECMETMELKTCQKNIVEDGLHAPLKCRSLQGMSGEAPEFNTNGTAVPSTPRPTSVLRGALPPTQFPPMATSTPTPSTVHAYDPCSGKVEGESCSMCPSGGERGECMETMVLKTCQKIIVEDDFKAPLKCRRHQEMSGEVPGFNANAAAVPSTPKPTPVLRGTLPPTPFPPMATSTPTPSTAHAYDPCSGKVEGESCSMCPSGGERGECMETMDLKTCQKSIVEDGLHAPLKCQRLQGMSGEVPGFNANDTALPSTPRPTPVLRGTLPPTPFPPMAISTPTPSTEQAYDPCSGKVEGESCTMCPSGGASGECMETMVLKTCQKVIVEDGLHAPLKCQRLEGMSGEAPGFNANGAGL